MAVDPVSQGIEAAATIANTVAGISDMNKRRMVEQNILLLTTNEKIELAKKIAASNNTNSRATILIDAVLKARDAAANREQKTQTVKWILIGSLGLGTLITIAWFLKK